MPTTAAAYPDVTTREEWLAARKKLLALERDVTHLRDAVNAERRRLPMVKVDKDYVFEGPDGELRLIDMFEGRPQLYIHHFMWIDAVDRGCPSCTMAADLTFTERDRALLTAKGVTLQGRARLDVSVVFLARQRLQLRLPRNPGPDAGADRIQLSVRRRVARRRIWRRCPARRLAWRQCLPEAR
jgi:predicted dithiol-disulfide oxidoreductase (DUF899 family)